MLLILKFKIRKKNYNLFLFAIFIIGLTNTQVKRAQSTDDTSLTNLRVTILVKIL